MLTEAEGCKKRKGGFVSQYDKKNIRNAACYASM